MKVKPLRKPFPLIEILIVVVILGILAAILLPQYKEAVKNAGKEKPNELLAEKELQRDLGPELAGLQPSDLIKAPDGNLFSFVGWNSEGAIVFLFQEDEIVRYVGNLTIDYKTLKNFSLVNGKAAAPEESATDNQKVAPE